MTVPIRLGGLYWVPDSAVALPPQKPNRVMHPKRPFLVFSNDSVNTDDEWPLVLGFPVTTSHEFATRFCVNLPKGTCPLPKESWVQVPLLQPLAKEKLQTYVGPLAANTLEDIRLSLIQYTDNL
ncbi:type II toxin-antitoxin system PemK/MazF family toxin [Microbacterium sp. C5A9]|uniref:type II toxin-antitoxin system PemK/MazF family toxin n=1 Tax=Microbacterium sp. C5A9 TaxID=2736663 RepID=UPI0035ABA9FD|nr:type II toxin-antitoxin system PemK/MazF family toxin [Microbacterium sp. C5A9]